MSDVERIMGIPFQLSGSRGPSRGHGRGPGRPWNGIVEETPALWIMWLKDIAKLRGKELGELEVRLGNRRLLEIVSVPLTFGERHYFRCALCGRRCEAVYFRVGHVGCRVCLRLGYRSQSHAPATPWMLWERLLTDRSSRWHGSSLMKEPSLLDALEKALRRKADKLISELIDSIHIDER